MSYEHGTDGEFAELIGKTLASIEGLEEGSDRVEFVCGDGTRFAMYHSQDCCESVLINDITGDVGDLIGSPILAAEEASSDTAPEGFKHEYEPEGQTWTFYKLATLKGYVDIRWFGSSNGWYSESVDFVRLAA